LPLPGYVVDRTWAKVKVEKSKKEESKKVFMRFF
jgi:hypothetical protein